MGLRFISSGVLDEDGNDTGEGYTIDDSDGAVYDENAKQIEDYSINEYGQVLDPAGNYVRNATPEEIDPSIGEPHVTSNSGFGGTGTDPAVGAAPIGGSSAGGNSFLNALSGGSKAVKDVLASIKEATGADWKDLLAGGLGAWALKDAMDSRKEYAPAKSAGELLAELPSNVPPAFSVEQMAAWAKPLKTGNQLERQYAVDMPSAMTPGIGMPGAKYAEGGEVEGALSLMFDSSQQQGLVAGQGGGQDDLVPARLSPGEYVFDAESVSMLGDGDNTAGARKLDELRAQLRAHKRSVPNDEIAPPAQGALSYVGGLNA